MLCKLMNSKAVYEKKKNKSRKKKYQIYGEQGNIKQTANFLLFSYIRILSTI